MPVLTKSYGVFELVIFRDEVNLKNIYGRHAVTVGQVAVDDADTSFDADIVNAEEQVVPSSVIDGQAVSGTDDQPPDLDGITRLLLSVHL